MFYDLITTKTTTTTITTKPTLAAEIKLPFLKKGANIKKFKNEIHFLF
jgi:hypothetical protein